MNNTWKELVDIINKFAKENNVSNVEIAKKTGLHKSSITRFFNAKYKPSLDLVVKIAEAVGVKITLINENAEHRIYQENNINYIERDTNYE